MCVTCGRPTLRYALESLQRQDFQNGDEVWLIHDGAPTAELSSLWNEFKLPGQLLFVEDGPHRDWGHTPRNRHLSEIKSGYVVNLDDDDRLAPHALATIRHELQMHPGAFFMFRISFPDGLLLWKTPEVREFNIGTATFVHPASIPLGTYTHRYGGDFDFIRETLRLNPNRRLIWSTTCPYLIRPHESWRNPRFIVGHEQPGSDGRIDWQAGWHRFFGTWFHRQSVLDVGAGLGQSRDRLAVGANEVTIHDVAPGLAVDVTSPVADIPTEAFDVVTAFDVIEHVDEDRVFAHHLLRIARRAIVITTPNVWISRCGNPYHVREYSPPALLELAAKLPGVHRVTTFASASPHGDDPAELTPGQFLRTMHPVLAIVAWKDGESVPETLFSRRDAADSR